MRPEGIVGFRVYWGSQSERERERERERANYVARQIFIPVHYCTGNICV